MKRICVLIYSIMGALSLCAQDTWHQIDTINGDPRAAATAFTVGSYAYVATGLEEYGFRRKVNSYDYFQNDWDNEASLGGDNGQGLERASAISFSIYDKGYVGLGQTETVEYMNDLWEFDPIANTWTQKANFIGEPRKQAVAFVLNDLGHVGTGQAASGLTNDFYTYDPLTNSWTEIQEFPGLPRKGAVAFSELDYGFVGTGDAGVLQNDFWMYDAALDLWIQKAPFPGTPRSGAVAWSTSFPLAYIALGEDNLNEFKKDVWEYNYYTNSWLQRSDFPGSGRKNAVAFTISGIAYVGTGFNGTFHDDFYAYSGTAGIQENKSTNSVSFYPNPTQSLIQIKGVQEDLIAYRIYAASGLLIGERQFNSVENSAINITNHTKIPGVYMIQLMANNQAYPLTRIILE